MVFVFHCLVFKGVLSSNGDDYMRFTIEKFVRKPITDDNNEIFAQSNDGAVKARGEPIKFIL